MKEIFADFLAKTSYARLSPPPQKEGLLQPALELAWPDDVELIALPDPHALDIPPADLRQMIEQRRSLRRYDHMPLAVAELSYLLWLTQGVKRITGRPATLRTVPSAGARHAFETYMLINRVDGLVPGLYRYIATRHALLRVEAPANVDVLMTVACHEQEHILQSAVTFIWMAVAERMTWRYVERSLRYLYLDAGHVCQNLYLAGESIQCGVCAIAAFDDETMNALIGADGTDRFVVYMATLGKK